MLVLGLASLSCDSGGTVAGPAAPGAGQNVSWTEGDGGAALVATLDPSGGLVVTRGGATLLRSPAGVPLVSRTVDPDNPDAWHDPTKAQTGLATAAVAASALTFGAGVSDGTSTEALHLVVGPQPADTALLTLTLADDGSFLTGLGEQLTHVSARGRVTPMFLALDGASESGTNDAHVPVPFLVSSAGWGLFVASREAGAFDVSATTPGRIAVTFEGRSLDVWLFVDPDPLAVVARYNRFAGLPRALPSWVLSPIHWRHWSSIDDVLGIAREYRTRHIPSSALWFDDGWQTGFNTFVLDPKVFEDAAGMMSELAALGFRTMAWTTPYLEQPQKGGPVDEAQRLYAMAEANRWFVEGDQGDVYNSPATPIKGGAGIVDFTSPGARAFWQALVSRATAAGIRGFKCDYGEELIPNLLGARNPVRLSDGTTAHTARTYPIEEHATYHAALDAAFPGDGALIVRASSWGGAQQADIIWPGDLDSVFQRRGDKLPSGMGAVGGLPAAVVDAQTLAVSGFPAFGSDTAGYKGSPTEESERRWMEHTALSIVMQVYEDGSRLPWTMSDAAGAEYQAMTSLHQRLVPYHAGLMREAQLSGAAPIRPLPLAYPGDAAGFAHADDEYMLGPDLLVAPVVEAGVTSRPVHLPPGEWVAWWTDRIVTGPADLVVPAPLGQPPLFARAGGLVPMLPEGIDTLGDATEPGVVTLGSRATEMTARAWASGTSRALLDDGSLVELADDGAGVLVTWAAGTRLQNLTIDVDTRLRSAPVTTVSSVSGAALAAVPTPADVSAASGGAWALAAGHAWVRLVGSGSARLR